MQAQIQTVRYVPCDCGEHRFNVEHLLSEQQYENGLSTQWTCSECGQAWKIVSDQKNQTIDMEKVGEPVVMHVLLRQQSTIDPVWLILKNPYRTAQDVLDEAASPGSSGMAYFYEEHTCPTNFLRGIEAIVANGDPDPHGLFEFVRAIPDSAFKACIAEHFPDYNYNHGDEKEVYAKLFPEAFVRSTFKYRIDHCRNGNLELTLTEHSHPSDIERGKNFRNELIGEALKIADQTHAKKGMLDALANAPGSPSAKPN